jgi:hypothetical protein
MSSRTAIATPMLIYAAFTADLHGCVRIESGGCICITNSKQLSHRLSGSFLIHATLRLGNAERFRKTVCRQLSFGARPFSLPTKSDASLCMRTGPGAMRLTRLGKDRLAFLAHHANHRCGGTTRVWCWRTKRGGCARRETKVSKREPSSQRSRAPTAWSRSAARHHTVPAGCEGNLCRRALAAWRTPNKGKIRKKKVYSPPKVCPGRR